MSTESTICSAPLTLSVAPARASAPSAACLASSDASSASARTPSSPGRALARRRLVEVGPVKARSRRRGDRKTTGRLGEAEAPESLDEEDAAVLLRAMSARFGPIVGPNQIFNLDNSREPNACLVLENIREGGKERELATRFAKGGWPIYMENSEVVVSIYNSRSKYLRPVVVLLGPRMPVRLSTVDR